MTTDQNIQHMYEKHRELFLLHRELSKECGVGFKAGLINGVKANAEYENPFASHAIIKANTYFAKGV